MTTAAPGLDLDALRALRASTRDLPNLRSRIEDHLDTHAGYLAFSGGKDSLVALHLATHVDPDVPVVFFDSGLEYPETYTYLENLADQWHLDLHVIQPQHSALELLVTSGAWDHHAPNRAVPDLHANLITIPSQAAHAQHGPGELWGVRAQEARGRAALYATALTDETRRNCAGCCPTPVDARCTHGGVVRRQDGTVVFGPVWDWKTEEVWAHIARHHLPLNPVYKKLRRLGAPEHSLRISHMIDGNHLERGRITWLRRGWPDLFDQLAQLLPRLRENV